MTLKERLLKDTINPEFRLSQKASSILEAIETFQKEGTINDNLLEGFSQNGNWIGVHGTKEIEMFHYIMQGTILPEEKRTYKDKNGNIHLLTSYRNLDKAQKLELPFKSIAGVLSAKYCRYLSAENLTSVGGMIELDKASKIDLPKLRKVGGAMHIPRLKEAELPKLEKVMGILNLYRSTILNAPNLKEVKHIRLETLSLKNRRDILKNLTTNSLKSIRASTYTPKEMEVINKELAKRKVLDIIHKRGDTNTITI